MSLDPPTRELVILDVNMESEETVTEDLVTVEDIKPEDPVANVFTRLRLFEDSSLTELGCSSWSSSKENDQPYCRGCSISPDGACCLVVVHCDGIHLIELDGQLLCGKEPSTDRKIDILDSVIHSKESGLVYDFCWYPGMDSALPETCCWLTTKRHAPIQMWDAYNGQLRCTYRGYDAVDEVDSALSLAFSNNGRKIFAGYKKCIKIFDTGRPGRDYSEQRIHTPAACVTTSLLDDKILLVGSWRTDISLFDINDSSLKSVMKFKEHNGGVTLLKILPDGNRFVSGARKDNKLLIWDLRYNKSPSKCLKRVVDSNQRIYFDVSPCGNYLVSGGTDGVLRVWDLSNEDQDACQLFPLYEDCCNGVSIHPYRPILATCSGQLHPMSNSFLDDEESDSENINSNNESNEKLTLPQDGHNLLNITPVNSFQFWWTGKLNKS